MALYAFNKTGSRVTLARGKPSAPKIPASAAPPARGQAVNVTSELRPSLTVDPINGVSGGLEAGDFTALQAQAASVDYEWDGQPEYSTPGLTVSGPAPGLHASTHEDGGADEISIAGLSGQAADPQIPDTHGSDHEDGGADAISTIPTAGEKAALAGTYGTPATGNEYRTKLDTIFPEQFKHHVDGSRADVYTADGSAERPYKTIQAAINAVAALGSAAYHVIEIASGIYVENLLLEHLGLQYLKLQADGYVSINPVAGNALQSAALNSNLKALLVSGLIFSKPVVITGPAGPASAFNDVFWDHCKFTGTGTLAVTCVNNFSMDTPYSECAIAFVNVAWSYIAGGQLQGALSLTMNDTLPIPSTGKDGTLLANGVFQSGAVSYAIGGTSLYTVAPQACRWGAAGAVTVPAGLTLLAYDSFVRGTHTNNGVVTLRNSHVEGYVAGTGSMTFTGTPNDPSAGEKAALAGSYGTPAATNPYVTKNDPGFHSATVADMVLYANSVTGDDANDGLTPATAVQTRAGVYAKIPHYVRHNVHVNLEGPGFDWAWNDTLERDVADTAHILVDGGAGLTVVADNAGSPWVSDINSLTSIGLSTLTFPVDQFTGLMVEITSGPALGDLRTVRANIATTVIPTVLFSVDPGPGATFRIVQPATEIALTAPAPYDFSYHLGNLVALEGDGTVLFQRITFTGFAPFNVCGRGGKNDVVMSACVLGNLYTIWRFGVILCKGGTTLGFTVYDPATLDLSVTIPANQAGVGSSGGDGVTAMFDALYEWNDGFHTIDGGFFNHAALNAAHNSGFFTGFGTRIKELDFNGAYSDFYNLNSDSFFGGFIPWGSVTPPSPGVYMSRGAAAFKDCDFSGSPHGVYLRNSTVYFEGAITGLNALSGVYARDASQVYLETAGVAITLTGTAIGDLTFDGAAAVLGGWAAVAAADKNDPSNFSLARVQARNVV
jgi:hypothetical protein